MSMANSEKTVTAAALTVLATPDAQDKANTARQMARAWQAGELAAPVACDVPARPARPDVPELRPPNEMPKRRKAGSLAGRTALLHAVAHIELNAIDLAADMVARFGACMPQAFTDDWVSVCDDEARHFMMLEDRLTSLESFYGALPAHDGLWQASEATRDDLIGRLVVVPMVLEARGLDVTPDMITRLEAMGDQPSADCLKIIYSEEVRHVAIGTKWFHHLTVDRVQDRESIFHAMVAQYFHGKLKPPFNDDARTLAGLPTDYYQPLAG